MEKLSLRATTSTTNRADPDYRELRDDPDQMEWEHTGKWEPLRAEAAHCQREEMRH